MSSDEDTELRDLVAQTLEANGVLGKIRAQLRASVFLALEEQESSQNKHAFISPELKSFVKTKEGRQITSLVREFLEFFKLEFTLAVFDPETGSKDLYDGRTSLARDLNIVESDNTKSSPLLAQLFRRAGDSQTPRGKTGFATEPFTDSRQDLSKKQILDAREKFEQYDVDESGTIDKDELRALFCDIFPGFHRNMIERYVNEEFRAVDMDFSNTIDFEEFLGMYKRLFILCKTTVSEDVADITHASPRRSKIPSPRSKQINSSISNSIVENKNKRNIENNSHDSRSQSETSTPREQQNGNDLEDDDPFFDDPLPNNDRMKNITSGKRSPVESPRSSSLIPVKVSSDKSKKSDDKGSSMSSLSGLPALGSGSNAMLASGESDVKGMNKRLGDLGFDMPDDDYDDDFESSNVSPVGVTPRSARSDLNMKSFEDEIDEEIEEELSVAEDLLKSDNSGLDDLTTDRTVSPENQNSVFDYAEEVMS